MTDSFFGFEDSTSNDVFDESVVSDEEDEDYDALNNETFGDDTWGGDWEENHEKLAELAELSRHDFNSENGDLSDKIASFILDDEKLEKSVKYFEQVGKPVENARPKPRPPPGFISNDSFFVEPSKPPNILNLKNLCTVEEIERGLIKPPPTSLRLEDLERKLINSVGSGARVPGFGSAITQLGRVPPTLPSQKLPLSPFQFTPPISTIPPHPLLMCSVVRPVQVPGALVGVPVSQHPEDPYAGLMTDSEKHWVGSIQLMQLYINQPFQHDYYHLMYQHRQSGGRKPFKPAREIPTLNKPQYTPLQFENSLGKLQAGSVTAPRKLIDTDIVEKTVVETLSTPSSSKKLKQILLEIEQMYVDVMKAEEILSPLIMHNVDNDVNPLQLFTKTVSSMMKNDKFNAILNIRKGKALVLRVMTHPEVSIPLAYKLLSLLPAAAKRDSDQSLLRALPAIRHYLHAASKDSLVSLALQFKPHLTFLIHDKFGVSVVSNLLERGESVGLDDAEWLKFIGALERWNEDKQRKEPERPVVGIPKQVLLRLLGRAEPPLSQTNIAILTRSLATLNSIDIH